MVFKERSYNTLVVSSSDKFNASMKKLLASAHCNPIAYADSVALAKRMVLEKDYDFVIINSPLPDDYGTKLAIDLSSNKNTVCLMFVKAEVLGDIKEQAGTKGIFILSKPISAPSVLNGLDFLASARERLRNLEKKTVSIEAKMEEIRLVNRAKWLLIDNLSMSEPDAHRYIEKQAMDNSSTKRDIAMEIIRTYS